MHFLKLIVFHFTKVYTKYNSQSYSHIFIIIGFYSYHPAFHDKIIFQSYLVIYPCFFLISHNLQGYTHLIHIQNYIFHIFAIFLDQLHIQLPPIYTGVFFFKTLNVGPTTILHLLFLSFSLDITSVL